MKLGRTLRLGSWFHIEGGQSYLQILRYLYPECITTLIIYFLPYFIDCLFICHLQSTSTYAVSGIIDNFLGMFLKAAEGLPIGIVIIAGYFNGLSDYKKVGQTFVDAFWVIMVIGIFLSFGLYCTAPLICKFNKFPPEMIAQGIPYLQMKSISIFFMFVYFSLVGFLRSVKNTFVPMVVFAMGSMVFVCVDYILIFGKCGFPQMCLLGSATASMIQYVFMCSVMLSYLLLAPGQKKYHIDLLRQKFSFERVKKLLMISFPVVVDKVSIAFAYAWLGSHMSDLGTQAGAAFSCIKMMERFAFIPAIACAQVVTFLVSNDLGRGAWKDIFANIKKILILATCCVGFILLIGSLWPQWFAGFVDKRGDFSHLVAIVFPALSILIIIDLLQLILSGALRGVGDVKTVMITRVCVIAGFFIPSTYVITYLQLPSIEMKMIVTYGAFLLGNGLMSIVYVYRLRQNNWIKQIEKARNG